MAVTVTPYRQGLVLLASGAIDFTTHVFKVALFGTSYTPDAATHDYFNDLSGEITGSPYLAGGTNLTVALSADSETGGAKVTVITVTWPAASFTGVRYAVVYRNTGTASTSPLLFYVDFGTTINPGGLAFALSWPTNLFRVRPPA